jgi:glycine cleavage system H lipoate-binding protein
MDGFQYIDIFSTKGLEYILVIFFLVMMLLFLRWMNTPVRPQTVNAAANKKRYRVVDWFCLDDDYFYHQGHTWVKPEAGNLVRIGVDDFAWKLVGSEVQWKLPDKGQNLRQGSKAWSAGVGDKTLSFLAPISGEIIQVNETLIQQGIQPPDPYDHGWFMLMRVPDLKAHLKNLLHGKIARTWMEHTVEKLSQLMTADSVPVLADGGQIKDCFLKEIVPQHWQEIAGEFLLSRDVEPDE